MKRKKKYDNNHRRRKRSREIMADKMYLNKELTVTYGLREWFQVEKKITINNREIDIILDIFDNLFPLI